MPIHYETIRNFISICVLLTMTSVTHGGTRVVSAAIALNKDTLPMISISLLSNLNYDLLYGRPGGYGECTSRQSSFVTSGCESPLKLVRSAMDDAAKGKDDFTFIAGGLMRHGTEAISPQEVEDTMKEVLGVISDASNSSGTATLPLPTVLAIGGTDLTPTNSFNPISAQPQYAQLLSLMMSEGLLTKEEHSHMADCGYYNRDVAKARFRVVVLNTVLWSNALRPSLTVGNIDPCDQFSFLQSSIEWARQRDWHVIILGSVPPVLNVEEALQMKSIADATYYWRNDFREAYLRIISANRFSVAAQFFSSTGKMGFVASAKLGPPMYIIPSVSPLKGNNPSYVRATLDSKTGRVVSLQQRYMEENGSWVQRDTLEDVIHIPLGGINEYSLYNVMAIAQSEEQWEPFARMRAGGRYLARNERCSLWCRHVIICASLHYDKEDIESCAASVLPSRTVGVFLEVFSCSLGVLVVLTAAIYALKNRHVIFSPPPAAELHSKRRLFPRRPAKSYS